MSRRRPELRATYDLRYAGQAFELRSRATLAPDPAELRRAFDRAHEERYGYSDPDAELELVTVRVAAALPGAEPPPGRRRGSGARRRRRSSEGPAQVDARCPGSTLVVPPGWRAQAEADVVVMER